MREQAASFLIQPKSQKRKRKGKKKKSFPSLWIIFVCMLLANGYLQKREATETASIAEQKKKTLAFSVQELEQMYE